MSYKSYDEKLRTRTLEDGDTLAPTREVFKVSVMTIYKSSKRLTQKNILRLILKRICQK